MGLEKEVNGGWVWYQSWFGLRSEVRLNDAMTEDVVPMLQKLCLLFGLTISCGKWALQTNAGSGMRDIFLHGFSRTYNSIIHT